MENKVFKIVPAKSTIDWTGRKVTGAHNGTIAIKEGELVFNAGKLAGGGFLIDTTSIKILDVTDPVTNAQFAGHLASDDFFASATYPEARFAIRSAEPGVDNSYNIRGDLTIRETTHPIVFSARVNSSGETLTASGKLVVDRTRYGMRFRSGNFFKDLGDALIYNDFDLNVQLTAEAFTKVHLPEAEEHNLY